MKSVQFMRKLIVTHRLGSLMVGVFGVLVLTVLLWPRHSVSSMPRAQRSIELMAQDVATVTQSRLESEVAFSGTLAPVRQMLLNARIAGEVVDVPVREGESVAAGALLLRQDNREMRARLAQAEASAQSIRAELQTAQEQAKNFRQLNMKNYFSRSDLDKAETQAMVLSSQLKAQEETVVMARKSLADAELHAPFAGIVAERMIEPGQMVMPNTPLLRVVDLRELELAIQLPSSEISRVHQGQKIVFRVDAFGDEAFTAKIVRLNPMAKASNRKITVYATVANTDLRLRGGLFARGVLEDSAAPSGLAIPLAAVQTHEGVAGVMVIRQERLVWQPVTLGQQDERSGRVLVVDGLTAGEVIVATRLSPRRAGSPVRIAPVAGVSASSTGA
ncbi:MAG: efflux RND transporter periplasmic adaptor subunit [Moraxellaceae bacterium]|nr:efflux RND transporter periplasmic adaptor subunit [Moraxellaceae bacterium]